MILDQRHYTRWVGVLLQNLAEMMTTINGQFDRILNETLQSEDMLRPVPKQTTHIV